MCKWGTNKSVNLLMPNEYSGRKHIDVDACIADLVQAFNSGGIETVGCCCGHGKGNGSIQLKDGRELIVISKKE